jgi:hypothetical protein
MTAMILVAMLDGSVEGEIASLFARAETQAPTRRGRGLSASGRAKFPIAR